MIRYNEKIDASNFRALAERHVTETVELLDGDGWRPHSERGGVEVVMREVEVARPAGRGGEAVAVSTAVRARVLVRAPRAEVFPLLAHPSRAPEWDTSDRGFQWVERFDDDHTVFQNFNQPPLFSVRDSVIYRVERAELSPGRSLYCARSVVHDACPPGRYPRILQQIFAWDVRQTTADACEVRVLCSTPENMIPGWLFRLVVAPGWRSILGRVREQVERGHAHVARAGAQAVLPARGG